MKTIKLELNHHNYPIYIGEKLLQDKSLLDQHIIGNQVLIVSNKTIAPLYLATIQNHLKEYQLNTLTLPDGEQFKNIDSLSKILDTLIENKHHRDTTLIALGGGVIGDMTGFAAACYQRGVNFIQIPTSLLAQVDASIGGKTAINHPKGKNLIGAFHQPQAVIIDIKTLNTLPDREFNAGLAEIIKAALLQDANFFTWLENNIEKIMARDPNAITEAIYQSCIIKRDIVKQDEKEQNIRALLNLGHTFGHAIEHLQNYQGLLHGEAVAIGTVLAAKLSQQLNYINETDLQRIITLFTKANLPTTTPKEFTAEQMIDSMKMDKKVLSNKIRLILLKNIGEAILQNDINPQFLHALLK